MCSGKDCTMLFRSRLGWLKLLVAISSSSNIMRIGTFQPPFQIILERYTFPLHCKIHYLCPFFAEFILLNPIEYLMSLPSLCRPI